MSRMTYGAAVFLKLNTIVNYISEVCYYIMRNIIGLGKGVSKSRFLIAIQEHYDDKIIKVSKNIEFILMNILIYIII